MNRVINWPVDVRFHFQVAVLWTHHTAVQCLAVQMPLHRLSVRLITAARQPVPVHLTTTHLCIPT